jgi:hypothetical protein
MPKNPNYTVTPALLACARADIERQRALLNEIHEKAVAAVADHDAAMALLDAELASLDEYERSTAALVERYAKWTPKGKLRPPRAGLPYNDKEKEQIAAAARGELERLAHELGRSYEGVLKLHEALLKPPDSGRVDPSQSPAIVSSPVDGRVDDVSFPALGSVDEAATTQVDATDPAAPSEALGSENPQIVEPTDAAASDDVAAPHSLASRELAEFDGRRKRAGAARPGIPVRGLTNDGPGHDREMDPVAWASRGIY